MSLSLAEDYDKIQYAEFQNNEDIQHEFQYHVCMFRTEVPVAYRRVIGG